MESDAACPHSCPHYVSGEALYQWRLQAQARAQQRGVAIHELDWLLQGISQLRRSELSLGSYRQREVCLGWSLATLEHQWQRRLQDRVPVQYLVGETPWRDLTLAVTPAVLIPRPETELVIDILHKRMAEDGIPEARTLADLGTGSGAIAIAMARAFPQAQILATDISAAALAVARHNAHSYQLSIEFLLGSWFAPLEHWRGRLAAVVTNPPYIPTETVSTLAAEVRCHEPQLALDGGHDGLAAVQQLIEQAPSFLAPGGLWLTELMVGQAQAVAHQLQLASYDDIQIHRDLGGIDRFVSARFKPS